ncbi:MAG: hypothetical protein AAF845_17130 [Bacteroidota bacterium]
MLRLALLLALAAALPQAPFAPDPEVAAARYHEGAQAFVNDDMEQARAAVDAGLQIAPDDPKLLALRDLLEQEQDEQQQQQGGQDQPQSDNSEEGDEGEDGPQGQSGDQPPPPDDPEAEADQTRAEPQDPGESQPNEGEQTGQRPGEGEATPQGEAEVEASEMSRAQAERILDAVGGEERLLLRELQRRPTRGRRADKDW